MGVVGGLGCARVRAPARMAAQAGGFIAALEARSLTVGARLRL